MFATFNESSLHSMNLHNAKHCSMNLRNKVAQLWIKSVPIAFVQQRQHPRFYPIKTQTKDCAKHWLGFCVPHEVQQTIFCAKPMKKLWLSATHLPPQRRCKLPQFLSPFPFTQRKNEPARTRSFLIRRDRRISYACHISYHALIYHKSMDGFISFIICL